MGLEGGMDVVEKGRNSLHRLKIGLQLSVRRSRSLVTKIVEL